MSIVTDIQMAVIILATCATLLISCGVMTGAAAVISDALVQRKREPLGVIQSAGIVLLPAYLASAGVARILWIHFFG